MTTISQSGTQFLRALSPQDFRTFGTGFIGYVRAASVDGRQVYALHAADGRLLTLSESATVAAMTARHNGLEPMGVQ